MKYIGIKIVVKAIIQLFFITIFLYLNLDIVWILFAIIISTFSNLLLTLLFARRYIKFKIRNLGINKKILKSSITFSLIGILTIIAVRTDIIMISYLGSFKEVGYYTIPFTITNIGLVFRNIFSTAFFPLSIKIKKKGIIKNYLKIALLLFTIILVCSIIISIISEDFVILIFGRRYSRSGSILSVLVFYLALSWATIPFSNLLQAAHRETLILITGIILACLNIVLNIILYNIFGLIGIAYSTISVYIVQAVLIILFSIKYFKEIN
jgi:O-antigen/teichoic acid export membrane protein